MILPLAQAAESKPEVKNALDERGDKLMKQAHCETLPKGSSEELWKVAECFRQEHNNLEAVTNLRKIVSKDPHDLEATFIAAWLLWEDGHGHGGREEQTRTKEALDELKKARVDNPTHWLMDTELGDFYLLRMKAPELALPEYLKARSHYKGGGTVEAASTGRKVSIENRVARTCDLLGRKGEAVEASCNALYLDPDDKEALERIQRLVGSCERKGVKDPRTAAAPVSDKD